MTLLVWHFPMIVFLGAWDLILSEGKAQRANRSHNGEHGKSALLFIDKSNA